jgi:large subunit ribosomal protein L9
MKIILKEEVKNLGEVGTIKNVADGYARNYLLPRNLAVEASTKNVKQFEHLKKQILAKAEKIKKSSDDLAVKLSSIQISIDAQAGEEDKLFGTITTADIADALSKQGVEVDKRKIVIEVPIKRLGTHNITVKLSQGVTAGVALEVIKKAE